MDGLSPPLASPVLGGLSLTNDDFRTHCVPMSTPHMIGPTPRHFTAPTEEPSPSYAIRALYNTPWSPCARHMRSQTVFMTSNVLSRPGISHGCPKWIHRVRFSSASSEGLASPVTTPALSPPRLHGSTRSSCLISPETDPLQVTTGALTT